MLPAVSCAAAWRADPWGQWPCPGSGGVPRGIKGAPGLLFAPWGQAGQQHAAALALRQHTRWQVHPAMQAQLVQGTHGLFPRTTAASQGAGQLQVFAGSEVVFQTGRVADVKQVAVQRI